MAQGTVFARVPQKDEAQLKQRQLQILDMVRVKVEEGQVQSLAFFMVAKDPAVEGGEAYTGSRFLVAPQHLDLVDDLINQMWDELAKHYEGLTPAAVRAMRRKG